MSEHSQVEQQLAIYRELSAAERQAVDRHVQSCAACAGTLAVYKAMDGALVRLPAVVPDSQPAGRLLCGPGPRAASSALLLGAGGGPAAVPGGSISLAGGSTAPGLDHLAGGRGVDGG